MNEHLTTHKCKSNDCEETEDLDPYLIGSRIAWYCGACASAGELPDDRTPIDLPDGYTLISQSDRQRAEADGEHVRNLLGKYENTIRSHCYSSNIAEKVQFVFSHLEHEVIKKQSEYNRLTEHVVEHLLGVRLLVNMVLNGANWTHAQKNNTIHALGELTETGIKRLREQTWAMFADNMDPFAPEWSIKGQYYARVKAEEERDELSKKLSELRAKHGIPIIDDEDEYSMDK